MNHINKSIALLFLSLSTVTPLFGQSWIERSIRLGKESLTIRQYIEDPKLANWFQPVDENAIPTIGIEELTKRLGKTYIFPEEAIFQKVKGFVEVRFYVDKNGKVLDYILVQDLGYETGSRLVKFFKENESWIPATYKGKNVGVWINFVLFLNFRDLTIT